MKTDERMSKTCYVVTYTGPFGFIKPWTAVRDELTYSQQFLTPSMVEGMRQKLDVSEIYRHRLTHDGFSVQGETTQSAGIDRKTVKKRQEVTYNQQQRCWTAGSCSIPVCIWPSRIGKTLRTLTDNTCACLEMRTW